MDGISLGKIIASGTTEQRNRAGTLLTELHFAAPQRVGLLHADPHPGNYMLTDDGRLAVIDFGSVARLPDGAPPIIGRVTRLALDGRSADVLEALRDEGFVPADYDPDPDLLMDYVVPFIEPLRHETFHFTRTWMQAAGRPDVELLQRGIEDGPAAQPAAVLPADPPGDVRVDRRAVPTGRHRPVPGNGHPVPARVRRRGLNPGD